MKKVVEYITILFLLSVFPLVANSQTLTYSDSVEISLLTCTPGEESWSQYGHTAIRYNDLRNGNDLSINYGLFSLSQSMFIPRFIFGLTDYRVGIESMEEMLFQYSYEGRGVIEQKLNLSKEEKYQIFTALRENLRPENVVYRYNFFYDNCTTRAQHILLDKLKGKTTFYADTKTVLPTYREMIHEWNKNDIWTQFGEDILLGVTADLSVATREQKLFLPDNLRKYIESGLHNGQPLVKSTAILLQPNQTLTEKEYPITPMQVAIIFGIFATIIVLIEYKQQKVYWIWDLSLLLIAGMIGLLLFAMVFSQHPCVSLNMIIFIFNPLCLIFLPKIIKNIRQKKSHWWFGAWGISIFIGLLGSFFQRIPLPILIVALFLLVNCGYHLWLAKFSNTTNERIAI